MINVTLKSQLSSTTAKINDIAYCIENKTFYRLSSTDESITIDDTDFIVSNGTNYWIAFGGQNSKVPQKVLNDDLDDSQNVISEIDSSFQLNDGILGLKNFNNDNVQYANKNGAWTEIVSSGGSSEVAPVITTTNLMLDATTHSHIFNNNTTDLIHILPLASENTGKRFLIKNKNTGLTYVRTAQVKITGDTTYGINGLYAENGYLNGRMSYISNYSNSNWNRIESDGVVNWGVYDVVNPNVRQYDALIGVTVFPYEASWNGITVTQVTDTMDGLTTIVLPVKGSYIEVESDGVTWNVIRESY